MRFQSQNDSQILAESGVIRHADFRIDNEKNSNSTDKGEHLGMIISWISITNSRPYESQHKTLPDFEDYKRIFLARGTKQRVFYFTKYYNDKANIIMTDFLCIPWLFSWNKASTTCKRIGSHLPEFYSKQEQEELR